MKKSKTHRWDPAKHLETEKDMAAYLEAALEEGDPTLVAAALGDIARVKGMTQIARETGLGRESLYKALSAEGNPEFATVLKVLRALGIRLHVTASDVRYRDHGQNITDYPAALESPEPSPASSVLPFAGAWSDMDESTFKEFEEEIQNRRRQAFDPRRSE
ncbi:MAG: probable transcriptional regulator [Leptospirillum rubarum]|jgi:probable addiction module antidote protein|nr:MAG: probable transcriptional regulator [Leptospirillum rubarum]